MTRSTIFSIIFSLLIVSGAIFLTGNSGSASVAEGVETTVIGDKQYIDMVAKGGYSPKKINAKAGMPLTIKMKTANTFDCSAFVVIPAISYRGTLNLDGTTEIPIPAQKSGTTIAGSCGMGMYGFTVNFL